MMFNEIKSLLRAIKIILLNIRFELKEIRSFMELSLIRMPNKPKRGDS